MRFEGKLKLSEVKVQLPAMDAPVKAQGIEIEWKSEFSIMEVKGMIEIVQGLPDVLAGLYEKFMMYQEQFSPASLEQSEKSEE